MMPFSGKFKWDTDCLKRICSVAIPNGVAQSIWYLATLAGVAMEPAFITVIGRCMSDKS